MVTKRITRKKTVKEPVQAEEKELRDYEMVFIIRPDIAEDNLDPVIDKVSQLITGNGGTVSSTERWGKRKLAYPIKHFTEGYYVLARLQMKATAGKEVESSLQISEDIIRYLLVKPD